MPKVEVVYQVWRVRFGESYFIMQLDTEKEARHIIDILYFERGYPQTIYDYYEIRTELADWIPQ